MSPRRRPCSFLTSTKPSSRKPPAPTQPLLSTLQPASAYGQGPMTSKLSTAWSMGKPRPSQRAKASLGSRLWLARWPTTSHRSLRRVETTGIWRSSAARATFLRWSHRDLKTSYARKGFKVYISLVWAHLDACWGLRWQPVMLSSWSLLWRTGARMRGRRCMMWRWRSWGTGDMLRLLRTYSLGLRRASRGEKRHRGCTEGVSVQPSILRWHCDIDT